MILLRISIIILRLDITFRQEPRFHVVFSPPPCKSWARHAVIDIDTNEYLPFIKIFVYIELKILEYVLLWSLIVVLMAAQQLKAGCCFNAIEIYSIQIGEHSVMLWEYKLLGAFTWYRNEFCSRTTSHRLLHDTRVKLIRNKFTGEQIFVFWCWPGGWRRSEMGE